jgi:hypothetical protein
MFREGWGFHPSRYFNFLIVATDAPRLRQRLAGNPVSFAVEGWRVATLQHMERVRFNGYSAVFTDDRSPAKVLGDLLFLRYLAAERR